MEEAIVFEYTASRVEQPLTRALSFGGQIGISGTVRGLFIVTAAEVASTCVRKAGAPVRWIHRLQYTTPCYAAAKWARPAATETGSAPTIIDNGDTDA